MKKIMIVDDELLVRTGIKSLVNWEKHGYQVVCDAANGEEAKEKIGHFRPDIILTDLKMEPGDGFELIRYCRKNFPEIKLLVLSNYNDFDNVRRAMKMGASDYLFKLMIKEDELLAVLEEAGKEIGDVREDSHEEILQNNLDSIKTGILKRLEEKDPVFPVDPGKLLRDIPLNSSLQENYRVVRMWMNNLVILQKKESFPKMDLVVFTMQNMIEEIAGRRYRADVFIEKAGEFVILLNADSPENMEYAVFDETFMVLADYIYRYYGCQVTTAVSRVAKGAENLRELIRETAQIKEQCLLRKRDHILQTKNRGMCAHIPAEFGMETMRSLLEQGNLNGFFERWEELLAGAEGEEDLDPGEFKNHLKKLSLMLYYGGEEHQIELEAVLDKNGVNLEEALEGYDCLEDLSQSVKELIKEYRKILLGIRRGKCRKEVNEAKIYVKSHLHEDLSAPLAARLVNMSVSRFSHVFKEDTGISFGEYVIEKRMNMAARLLAETDLKINEIAAMVGIDNPNYFSTQFKRKFQMAPVEYRRNFSRI